MRLCPVVPLLPVSPIQPPRAPSRLQIRLQKSPRQAHLPSRTDRKAILDALNQAVSRLHAYESDESHTRGGADVVAGALRIGVQPDKL